MLGGRLPALLLLTLLITPGLVGCIGDQGPDQALDAASTDPALRPGGQIHEDRLTEPLHEVLPVEEAYVEMSLGGIQLYAEVFLPEGQGPWPTILELSPYNALRANGAANVPAVTMTSGLVDYYVPRGYAVVLAHVRGTGNSEGCLDMMGHEERQDAHDMVEWVAEQPFSDGKVAMHGVSYVGTTPHEAAVMAPEHLTTIVTVAGVTNQWRNTFMNGVPYNGRHYPLTYNAFSIAPPTDVQRGPAWGLNVASATCGQGPAVQAMSPGTYEKGLYDDYWAARNMTRWVDNVTVPVFYNQGFDDRAVNPSEAIYWFNELDVPKKAFLHQGAHMLPPREDYKLAEHAWFDHWLKGIDTGIMDTPTVEVLTNDASIRLADAWPPANWTRHRLHLAPGELTTEAPAEGTQTYLADMARNAATDEPATGTEADPLLTSPLGPAGLPSQLVYTSAPLEQDLYLAGEPRMHLVASVDAENTYFLFDLYDRDAGTGEERWIAEGWFNAHLWEGYDTSAPLTPGEAYAFDFRFEPREYVFEAGHQLRLVLRGHDDGVFPVDQPATQNTVAYGPAGSWLDLPVLEAPQLFERPEDI